MLNIGPQELLVILVIALLVVGPQRLPELGRSLGRWMRELRNAQDEVRRTIQVNLDDEPNGDGAARQKTRPAAARRPSEVPAPGVQDPTPTVGDTPTAEEVREISRSLGRSLAQLRKAREEMTRSFRVDLDAPAPGKSSSASAPPARNGDAPPTDAPDAEPVSDDPARG